MMRALVTSFLRNRTGAAAAEMALVLPLLMTLLFGAFEAGNYFWNEHIVVKAVRDGARFAGRQSFTSYSCSAVDSFVEGQIKNLTRTGSLSPGATARVIGWVDGDITVSVSCDSATTTGIYEDMTSGAPRVQVRAVVPYTPLFGILGFDTTSLDLVAESNSAVMGL
jgi:Flp pilus assembly protein TadG